MERGDPLKQRQRDYRLEENEEGDAALELTLGPPGEEPCKKKGNQGTLHFLSLGTPDTTTTITCPSSYLEVEEEEDGGERKAGAYVVPPPPLATAVQKSQKRCAPAAVVGWPPIRSYRRNIAGV
ncbi:hypothetical protein MLD38_007917 [Melastoma candidum]|uniref:Uncharacterized protein n=1 Tax=Melastoma candidum TaxID=119954 RepID=A0ACB9RSU9_9MYRT|nr:hypothetical protein MLD38_007917 [Melastoma candidum]